MPVSTGVLPVVVAVVLLVAGVAKIRHRADTRGALGRFGFPPAVIPAIALVLPWGEIAVAALLLLGGPLLFALGAAGALVLTGGFFFVVARAARKGETFECGCFGTWERSRIGPLLVIRNGALLAAAIATAALAIAGLPGVPALLGTATGADAQWAVMLAAAMGLTALFAAAGASARSAPTSLAELPTQPDAQDATATEVVTASGAVTRLRDLALQHPQVIVFVRHGCGSCEDLLRDVESDRAGTVDVLFAVSGDRTMFETAHPGLASRALYAVQAARSALGVSKTPAAVVIGLNGTIAAGPVSGAAAVRELLVRTAQTA
ncbi:MauE/DoxX family redox-associated membrane protein [Microbacterium sp. NPDC087592]|uniref:MauE/DoxX family redox-associated membrane protein n=1 Tax=Microbacterium sp. NPDC087592 TaxID=3364193 RepID=UPI0038285E13